MALGPAVAPGGLQTSTRALDHLGCAAGLTCVRNGFAFTKQMDAWFALGWPHFVTLVHGLPEVADPVDAGNKHIGCTMSVVPAEIANGLGRVHQRVSGYSDWSSKDKRSVMNKWALKQFKRRKPVSPEEAYKLLSSSSYHSKRFVLIMEALVGPKVVVDGLMACVESLPEKFWTSRYIPAAHTLQLLHLLMLRLARADEAKTRKRLERLYDKWIKSFPNQQLPPEAENRTPLHGVALALHGAEAAKNWGLFAEDFPLLSGSPAWLKKQLATWTTQSSLEGYVPDPRRVFLAGVGQVKNELKIWTKYRGGANDADRYIVQTYGMIKSPDTVTLMVDMLGRSRAKGLVKAWFAAHADYAAKHVDKLAKGRGALVKPAKDVAKLLG